jgi:hypothetical protein
MWDWLLEQWRDISGNVKFWLLCFVGGAVLTAVKYAVRALDFWQQAILIGLFVLVIAWALFASWRAGHPKVFDSRTDNLTPVHGQKFKNEKVEMDGKDFYRCTFENVTYVLKGTRPFNVRYCDFVGSRRIELPPDRGFETVVALQRGLGLLPADLPFLKNGEPLITVQPPTMVDDSTPPPSPTPNRGASPP